MNLTKNSVAKEYNLRVNISPEEASKKLSFFEIFGKRSIGKNIKIVLDNILEGETSSLIVVNCSELESIIERGFKINHRFTSQKLAELAKMDDTIILLGNLKKILLGITFKGVIDIGFSSRVLFELSPNNSTIPKVYRLLEKLNLTEKEIKSLVSNLCNFFKITNSSNEELSRILRAKTESFREKLTNLKEQILVGKRDNAQ